jgi:N-acyl-D-amino-acid deacylase
MFDVVIRGGTVFDGLGSEGAVADVAISDAKIVQIGHVTESARRTIDASDLFVAPGFVDGHTHLDAQIFWDPYGGSLTAHGVTSAVMGNCGFSLAPGTGEQADLILRSIERAEDMSRAAIQRGVPWSWRTFPEYMDAVEALPKALNIAAQCGHSAVRASVMGERAFTDGATDDEVRSMRHAVQQAISAGALGFSTSRSRAHLTKAGDPVASRVASWDEVSTIVTGMGEVGAGIFQLAPERPSDPGEMVGYQARLRRLAVMSRRPVTFMVGGQKEQLDTVDGVVAGGGTAIGQVHVRGFENVFGFKTTLPFDRLPLWKSVRSAPLDEQRERLLDPQLRARLVTEAESGNYGEAVGAEVRAPQFDQIMIIDPAQPAESSVADVARSRDVSPIEVMIDLSLDSQFEQLFRQPISETSSDLVLAGLRHPNTVVAASDSGAHISQILDSNIPTYFLSHWVRGAGAFTWAEAIHMLTGMPAGIWGLDRRGVLQAGAFADVVVFDPSAIACAAPAVLNDLPDGGPRLAQSAVGIDATLVNGQVVMSGGQPTGAVPGVFMRGGTGLPPTRPGRAEDVERVVGQDLLLAGRRDVHVQNLVKRARRVPRARRHVQVGPEHQAVGSHRVDEPPDHPARDRDHRPEIAAEVAMPFGEIGDLGRLFRTGEGVERADRGLRALSQERTQPPDRFQAAAADDMHEGRYPQFRALPQ